MKITKIIYGLPEYLKRDGGLVITYGPDAKRLHDAMRKAGKVAPPPRKQDATPEEDPKEK